MKLYTIYIVFVCVWVCVRERRENMCARVWMGVCVSFWLCQFVHMCVYVCL